MTAKHRFLCCSGYVLFWILCLFGLSSKANAIVMWGDVEVAEGATEAVTSETLDSNYSIGNGNYLNNAGTIKATTVTKSYTVGTADVSAVIPLVLDPDTGTIRFINTGTISAINMTGCATGIFYEQPASQDDGVTMQFDAAATGHVIATGTNMVNENDNYVSGMAGTYADLTTVIQGDRFNVQFDSTSEAKGYSYAKSIRVGNVDIGEFASDITSITTSHNSRAEASALDCRYAAQIDVLSGVLRSTVTTHDVGKRPSTEKNHSAGFGIYAYDGISIGTLAEGGAVVVTVSADTTNTAEGTTDYQDLYSHAVQVYDGDITISHLCGEILASVESTVDVSGDTVAIWASKGDLTVSELTGSVRAISNQSGLWTGAFYASKDGANKGNITITSRGLIEAYSPYSPNAVAIQSGGKGDVTLENGAETKGQIILAGVDSELTIESGASLTVEGTASDSSTTATNVNGVVTNAGTITASGVKAVGVYLADKHYSLVNTGTITADGSSSSALHIIAGTAETSGTITATNGATACIAKDGGTLSLTGDAEKSITGLVAMDGANLTVESGDWSLTRFALANLGVAADEKTVVTVQGDGSLSLLSAVDNVGTKKGTALVEDGGFLTVTLGDIASVTGLDSENNKVYASKVFEANGIKLAQHGTLEVVGDGTTTLNCCELKSLRDAITNTVTSETELGELQLTNIELIVPHNSSDNTVNAEDVADLPTALEGEVIKQACSLVSGSNMTAEALGHGGDELIVAASGAATAATGLAVEISHDYHLFGHAGTEALLVVEGNDQIEEAVVDITGSSYFHIGNHETALNEAHSLAADVSLFGDGTAMIVNHMTLEMEDIHFSQTSGGALFEVGDAADVTVNDIDITSPGSSGTINVTEGTLHAHRVTLNEASTVTVGTSEGAGHLDVETFAMQGATLFLDPAWSSGVQLIEDASMANIASFSTPNTIDGHIVVGQNSIVSLGTSGTTDAIHAIRETEMWGEDSITAALYLKKHYTIASGASLKVDGSLTSAPSNPSTPDVVFANDALLSINKDVFAGGQTALTSATGTLTVDPGAYLQVVGAAGGTYSIAQFQSVASDWDNANVLFANDLLSATVETVSNEVRLTVTQQDAATFFGARGTTARFIDAYTTAGMSGVDSTPSERYMTALLTGDTSRAASGVETGANLAGLGGVAHTSFDIVDTSRKLTEQRIPASGSSLLYLAKTSEAQQFELYATPIYQYTEVSGMRAGNYANSFTTNIYGIALGVETASADWLLGVAINFGKADTDGSRASSGSTTDNEYVSLLGYGAYVLPEGFLVNGEFIYSGMNADVDNDSLSSDLNTNVFSVGLEGTRPFIFPQAILTPYVGIEYAYYDQEKYDSKNSDGDIFSVKSADMSVWTLPLGLTLTKVFTIESGWKFNGNVDVGVTFAFGDTDITTDAILSGSSFVDRLPLRTDVYDDVTGNLQLGFVAEKGPFIVAVDLNGNISEHKTYRGAMLKVGVTF